MPNRAGHPKLELLIRAKAGKGHVPFLRQMILRAHRLYPAKLRELSLALVGDREMGQLHLRFMNIPGPTDVLTFPLEMDQRGRAGSGEIVICVPEARRRAKEENVPLEHELLLYAIHGMLHLDGLDDRTDSGYRKMHRIEDQLLTRLGIGPTFAPKAENGRPKRSRR